MPALDRDAILQALMVRLQDRLAGEVKTFTRRLEQYENTPHLPALLLTSERHTPTNDLGNPPIWRIAAEIRLWVETTESDTSPETQLNALVWALENALERQPAEARPITGDERSTSLGGLCSSCLVTGVEVVQGAESGWGSALVTLSITAPAS
jgi:hypothetical protein